MICVAVLRTLGHPPFRRGGADGRDPGLKPFGGESCDFSPPSLRSEFR